MNRNEALKALISALTPPRNAEEQDALDAARKALDASELRSEVVVKTKRVQPHPQDGRYITTIVAFDRLLDADEVDNLRENYGKGIISAHPDSNLVLAVEQQLAVELQESYDDLGALTGNFLVLQSFRGHVCA